MNKQQHEKVMNTYV